MKNTKFKMLLSIISTLIIVALTLSGLAGCGDKSESPKNSNNNKSVAEENKSSIEGGQSSEPAAELKPDLPENVDMDGKTFTILVSNYANYEPLTSISI